MIREIVRPTDHQLTIQLPREYVGQEIEYIVFPLQSRDEPSKQPTTSLDSVGGILHAYAAPEKIEQEASAWAEHVMEKYAQ